MRKHLKTVGSALAALGLVAAALGMSAPAMAGTSGKCGFGAPTCYVPNTNSAAYFTASWDDTGGSPYETCIAATNPASTSKTIYFRYEDDRSNWYHDSLESGNVRAFCNNTGTAHIPINFSYCGFDPSCG
jgi:hypothetical protein